MNALSGNLGTYPLRLLLGTWKWQWLHESRPHFHSSFEKKSSKRKVSWKAKNSKFHANSFKDTEIKQEKQIKRGQWTEKIYTQKQDQGLGLRQQNSTRQAIVLQTSIHFTRYFCLVKQTYVCQLPN